MVKTQLHTVKGKIFLTLLFILTGFISSCQLMDFSFLGFESEEQQQQSNATLETTTLQPPAKQNWCFSMRVPDGNWSLRLDKFYQKIDGDYVALGKLWRHKGNGIQVISRRSMCGPLIIEENNVTVIITGKIWEWRNQENATFVNKIPTIAADSILLYQFDPKAGPIKPEPTGNPVQ